MTRKGGAVGRPELLTPAHDLTPFACGVAPLDDWLRRRALGNQESGASRTYVVSAAGRVVGFYALATGAVAAAEATGRARRNMPDPVPVMVLGRLAIDQGWHGCGLGRALLRDAIWRTLQAAGIAGIRALLVHAIFDKARLFYLRAGFRPSPVDPMMLMITLADGRRAIGA